MSERKPSTDGAATRIGAPVVWSRPLTEGQREALAVLAKSNRPLDTNQVSAKAGHRYGPWAYGKLRALEARGLATHWLPDRVTLATWTITREGREAHNTPTQGRETDGGAP